MAPSSCSKAALTFCPAPGTALAAQALPEFEDFDTVAAAKRNITTAIERVAEASEDAEELVGWCFLDYLSLDTRRAVIPRLGPSTLSILETIEDP